MALNKDAIAYIEFFPHGNQHNSQGRPELVISFLDTTRDWVRVFGDEAEKGWKNYQAAGQHEIFDAYGLEELQQKMNKLEK